MKVKFVAEQAKGKKEIFFLPFCPEKNTAYQCLFTANIPFSLPAKRDFPESRNNL